MTNSDIKKFIGEQDEIQCCYVTFRLVGENIAPEKISKTLAIIPTKSYSKGETYKSKSGQVLVRPIGHWSLSTESNPSKSLESHCQDLVKQLDGRDTAIELLRKNDEYRVSIILWWQGDGSGHGSYNLLSETVLKLSKLCDDIEFHFL
jgi:hypothetical protein